MRSENMSEINDEMSKFLNFQMRLAEKKNDNKEVNSQLCCEIQTWAKFLKLQVVGNLC